MRRFLGLALLLLFAAPLGLSIAGCAKKNTVTYCSGNLESGPVVGQVQTITLAGNLAVSGESLNFGQISGGLSASAQDCNGASVSVTSGFTYATTNPSIADVNPANGSVCAGTWNRNTGGGIGDYTLCAPPASSTPTNRPAYITASANGATSNPIAVYIHPQVTGVALSTGSSKCDATLTSPADPDSTCLTSNGIACNQSTIGATQTYPEYSPLACVSQNVPVQLAARVYAGPVSPANNITCQVGPVNFALQGATNVATVNAQGVATAVQPGSALVTATVSNSASALSSGFFSTCPPASIQLAAANQPPGATRINVALNTPQSLTATVLDTNNKPITGLQLEFNSTLPVNFPASAGVVTPVFPGTATITASCNPPICNPAPFSQIGYLGNGKPITSNGITVTAAGTSASVLYMASSPSTSTVNGKTVTNLGSQYVVSEDFTTGQLASPLKLPFVPNSLVISQDGSTLYLGSSQGLMTVSTAANSLTSTFTTVQGPVLTVAPNNSFVVVTDPVRQTVSLINSTGGVFSSVNGVGTRAEWTPDSSTLYVTATVPASSTGTGSAGTPVPVLLTYTTFTGWETTPLDEIYNDVAVTVPDVGAYFAGPTFTEGRSYCSATSLGAGSPPSTTNIFSPIADSKQITTDRLNATTDGNHILGATAVTPATLYDLSITLPPASQETDNPLICTTLSGDPSFTSTVASHQLAGPSISSITGIVSASNSASAFVTYTGSGNVLPLYQPAAGTVTNIPLSGTAVAPVAGVYSSDDTTFYVGTSGDNQVHVISVTGATSKDTGVITPNLPDPNNNIATPNLIAQRVRRTTS